MLAKLSTRLHQDIPEPSRGDGAKGIDHACLMSFPGEWARGRERLSAQCSLLQILYPAGGCSDHVPSVTVTFYRLKVHFKSQMGESPGGPVGKKPPPMRGSTDLIPGPGRFYLPQGNKAGVPELLRLRSGSLEPQSRKPKSHRATTELV